MSQTGLTQGTETRKTVTREFQTAKQAEASSTAVKHEFVSAEDAAKNEAKKAATVANHAKYMADVRAAVPGWVKANTGLRGREARIAEKAIIERVRKEPFITETEIASPNYQTTALGESSSGNAGDSSTGSGPRPLQISKTETGFRVARGQVCGFTIGPATIASFTGDFYLAITVTVPTSGSSGSPIISGVTLETGSTPGAGSSDTIFYYKFGQAAGTTAWNTAYGPIDGHPYRKWFSNPPKAGLFLVGSNV